jgi:hypothetical protein
MGLSVSSSLLMFCSLKYPVNTLLPRGVMKCPRPESNQRTRFRNLLAFRSTTRLQRSRVQFMVQSLFMPTAGRCRLWRHILLVRRTVPAAPRPPPRRTEPHRPSVAAPLSRERAGAVVDCRPVAPEVAGSSPVAPVFEVPASADFLPGAAHRSRRLGQHRAANLAHLRFSAVSADAEHDRAHSEFAHAARGSPGLPAAGPARSTISGHHVTRRL